MSDKRNGPKITIKASCFDCRHEQSEDYVVQGDSGHHVFCAHPDVVAESAMRSRRRIGDTAWDTPEWCPFLTAHGPKAYANPAIGEAVRRARTELKELRATDGPSFLERHKEEDQ